MKEISELEDKILSLVDTYNKLSLESDNDRRLALLVANSNKSDFYPSFDGDSYDEVEEALSHQEFVEKNGKPTPNIIRATEVKAWFASSIC